MFTINTKLLTRSALLIAVGIILPYIAHLTGVGGSILLPMHLSPLLAGFIVGPLYGLIIGAILPPLNFAVSGMPPMPMTVFMIFELAAFGLITGILYKKFNVIITLISAMLAGRVIYAIMFALIIEFQNPLVIIGGGIATGLPGIVIQIVLIPIIVKALENRSETAGERVFSE